MRIVRIRFWRGAAACLRRGQRDHTQKAQEAVTWHDGRGRSVRVCAVPTRKADCADHSLAPELAQSKQAIGGPTSLQAVLLAQHFPRQGLPRRQGCRSHGAPPPPDICAFTPPPPRVGWCGVLCPRSFLGSSPCRAGRFAVVPVLPFLHQHPWKGLERPHAIFLSLSLHVLVHFRSPLGAPTGNFCHMRSSTTSFHQVSLHLHSHFTH